MIFLIEKNKKKKNRLKFFKILFQNYFFLYICFITDIRANLQFSKDNEIKLSQYLYQHINKDHKPETIRLFHIVIFIIAIPSVE